MTRVCHEQNSPRQLHATMSRLPDGVLLKEDLNSAWLSVQTKSLTLPLTKMKTGNVWRATHRDSVLYATHGLCDECAFCALGEVCQVVCGALLMRFDNCGESSCTSRKVVPYRLNPGKNPRVFLGLLLVWEEPDAELVSHISYEQYHQT